MKRWSRRLFYFLIALVWLMVMLFPVVAVVLATQDQIQIGDDPQSYLRLFLVQDRDTGGLGIQWTRRAAGSTGCAQSSLRYLLWKGEGENVTFCRCYDASGALVTTVSGSCRAQREN